MPEPSIAPAAEEATDNARLMAVVHGLASPPPSASEDRRTDGAPPTLGLSLGVHLAGGDAVPPLPLASQVAGTGLFTALVAVVLLYAAKRDMTLGAGVPREVVGQTTGLGLGARYDLTTLGGAVFLAELLRIFLSGHICVRS